MGAADPGLLADAEDPLVREVLAEYGQLTREHLCRYLPEAQPGTYLSELVSDYPLRGGKMLRPSLCIAAACAFGRRPAGRSCVGGLDRVVAQRAAHP